jgi:hydrogenase maturation protease
MPAITSTRCLILACGNSLRGDDGVGPSLATWAEERFHDHPTVRVISCLQWTPELAEDIAHAHLVIFIDCSVESAPGSVHLIPVDAGSARVAPSPHRLDSRELLALSRELYGASPADALLLTIGAGSIELCEGLSEAVAAVVPEARLVLEEAVLRRLSCARV